ncbi:hypothetical protein LNKW23_13070 [Paralimibaculum aggregatum]|uniref:SecA family profile domain-containing protein n=1 Tax=Paralimibaculum aggregatum TaxID=3036245 RepID=A0ABQ6LN86_9RHOB|nr:hypothetical protein [Limibaculum sp. NKW23]GMG82094.1 hypothetical protein LNKW23_13070 [Limibaculum sp. NKW23]
MQDHTWVRLAAALNHHQIIERGIPHSVCDARPRPHCTHARAVAQMRDDIAATMDDEVPGRGDGIAANLAMDARLKASEQRRVGVTSVTSVSGVRLLLRPRRSRRQRKANVVDLRLSLEVAVIR